MTAQALIEVFPSLGRLMAVRMRESGEEEATLMQIGVLLRLREQPTTASELAKMRKVSLQSASVLVQGLVDRGWLVRTPHPNDRRQSILHVTPEGAAFAQAAQEQMTDLLADLLHELSVEELNAAAVLLPALRRIVAAQLHLNEATEAQP